MSTSTVAHFSAIRNTGKKAESLINTILAINNYHSNCPAVG